MATKAELKERLVTGHVLTEQDIQDIIDVAGKDGAKGAKGDPGKDGFPSQEEWDALVARVTALEATPE